MHLYINELNVENKRLNSLPFLSSCPHVTAVESLDGFFINADIVAFF
jgi:hypothetical protein